MIGKGIAIAGIWLSCAATTIAVTGMKIEGWGVAVSFITIITLFGVAAGVTAKILEKWDTGE